MENIKCDLWDPLPYDSGPGGLYPHYIIKKIKEAFKKNKRQQKKLQNSLYYFFMCLKVTCHDKNLGGHHWWPLLFKTTIDWPSGFDTSNKDADEDFWLSWCTDFFSVSESEIKELRKTARWPALSQQCFSYDRLPLKCIPNSPPSTTTCEHPR